MIISCPSCNSGFYVTPSQIGATGRRVKCSKCKNVWHATIPSSSAAKEEIIAQRLHTQHIVTGANLPAVIPIKIPAFVMVSPAIFTFLILISLWVFYPNITSRYGLCGPMCVPDGVRIEDVTYNLNKFNNKVTVEYSIANRTKTRIVVPAVQLKLLDKKNISLRTVTAQSDGMILEPNSSVRAKTDFNSVSKESKFVEIFLGNNIKFLFR